MAINIPQQSMNCWMVRKPRAADGPIPFKAKLRYLTNRSTLCPSDTTTHQEAQHQRQRNSIFLRLARRLGSWRSVSGQRKSKRSVKSKNFNEQGCQTVLPQTFLFETWQHCYPTDISQLSEVTLVTINYIPVMVFIN